MFILKAEFREMINAAWEHGKAAGACDMFMNGVKNGFVDLTKHGEWFEKICKEAKDGQAQKD